MFKQTGLAPWEFEFPLPCSLTSSFLLQNQLAASVAGGQSHLLSPLHEPLHGRAKRDLKAKMLHPQSFLRKGVSLGYVGRNYNLKNLKDLLLQNKLAASVAGGAIWMAVLLLQQTDQVRTRTLVLVASIWWGPHCPMGTENDECTIHLPPRYLTKAPSPGRRLSRGRPSPSPSPSSSSLTL